MPPGSVKELLPLPLLLISKTSLPLPPPMNAPLIVNVSLSEPLETISKASEPPTPSVKLPPVKLPLMVKVSLGA